MTEKNKEHSYNPGDDGEMESLVIGYSNSFYINYETIKEMQRINEEARKNKREE